MMEPWELLMMLTFNYNGWKRWTHVHRTKGVWWALTAVENFKGFVDSRRIAATFNDLRKWQVSRLSHKPSQPTVALPHRMIVTSDYLVLLSQWQQVWTAGPLPSEHIKDRLKLCFRVKVTRFSAKAFMYQQPYFCWRPRISEGQQLNSFKPWLSDLHSNRFVHSESLTFHVPLCGIEQVTSSKFCILAARLWGHWQILYERWRPSTDIAIALLTSYFLKEAFRIWFQHIFKTKHFKGSFEFHRIHSVLTTVINCKWFEGKETFYRCWSFCWCRWWGWCWCW